MPEVTVAIPQLGNDDLVAAAAIESTKVVHQKTVAVELAEAATAVVAIDKILCTTNASGTLQAFEGTVVTEGSTDRTVTIDLHKSTGGGAFGTVLSSTIDMDNATVALVPVAGTITTATVAAGDVFKIGCTVAGASGSQAKGLVVTWIYDENPIG